MIEFIVGLITGAFVGMVATALCAAGADPPPREREEISCRRCRHSTDGKPDDRNTNCALCITRGAWSGFERMREQ